MMSLSQLRTNLFQTFALMKSTDLTVDVYHRRKVYRLHIEETGEKVQKKYKARARKAAISNALIDTEPCSECGSLIVNGLCMSKVCVTNTNVATV